MRLCIPNLEPAPFGTLKVRGPRKHAFAPRAFAHPENRPSSWRATARQRGFCPSRWLRHASGTPDAGDDPINSSDPSGLCSFFNIWCDVFGGGRPPVCRTAICVVSPPTTWPGLGPLDVPREAYNYINSFADHGMTTRQFQTVAYLEWLETDGPNGGAAQLTQSVVAQSAGCNPTGPNAAPQYAAYACAASAVIKYRPGQFNGAKPTVYTAEQFYQDYEYTLTYLAVALNGKLLENLDKADGMDKLYEIIDKAPEVVAMATLASTFTPAATGPAPGCGTTA